MRCSILDIMVNLLGPAAGVGVEPSGSRRPATASPGCRSPTPACSTGSTRCSTGHITPAQFVDLNEKVGGLDINADPITERIQGDPASIENVYRTGLVNEANHLDEVAIINHGGPDPGAAHDYSHAWWTEERLLADQGHTDNRVMWFGTTPLIGNPDWAKRGALRDGPLADRASRRTSATPR